MSTPLLRVDGLTVTFARPGQPALTVVRELSFSLAPGRAVALVGESGSGKSVSARSLVGLAGAHAQVSARVLAHAGRDLRGYSERQWQGLRGKDIGFVLQDALVSLDPLRPVGREIEEALAAHGWGDRARRRDRVLELLQQAGVPEPALRARQRPDQLSGGLRQRALIASALANAPGILIADEPTTALDATVQVQVLAALQAIKRRGGALLVISHDLALVAQLADEVVVLRHGEVVEQGPIAQVLQRPAHAYTRALLAAIPSGRGPRVATALAGAEPANALAPPLLEVRGLRKAYRGPDGEARLAVDGVDLVLQAGRTLGVVGESGSGKSSLARLVLGLTEADAGEVRLNGRPWIGSAAARVSEAQRRPWRRAISAVYQDPLSSFDPRWTVARILGDALDAVGLPRAAQRARIAELLEQVRLGTALAGRFPLQLSGGQRQRVAIARAIATEPRLIVLDEAVSALDVSVQAQVLDLLADLQAHLGLAYLFISHDLGVIRQVSHDILVMRHGQVQEAGPAEQVFAQPRSAYTRALLAAMPRLPAPVDALRQA
ncbi:ABC transporter ATP-binding protein [Xanthomonas campestris pv. trichodesmae]|uniref:ABC transporter ATP-binding protein n=1 Tax=Xanthomonas citri pv. vignicola TaxID=473426 RepID=A0AB33CLS0_XANCI|nr:ABC transporter ATP-binding protein [Xanthomonas citri]ASK93526.1 ABC transporter ATP-binding protein [Xanthomonas citri pv. vignicola]MBV6780719.1 ABC transporter ATP-binding protein [Xanthomonas campestris pv. trichodesmae]